MDFKFIPIKTRVIMPPKDLIWDIIDDLEIEEGDIVFITSKILAIHQGRAVKAESVEKEELIRKESEYWLQYKRRGGWKTNLTITDNVLIPAAGIDESNANEHYILWPIDSDQLCREIRSRLIQKHKIKNLGIVATDSHTTPLRWGVTGIAIGLAGVLPTEDLCGKEDIFGRPMNVTKVNKIDALTGMAVLLMGEASETIPIVILRGFKGIDFDENASMEDFKIALDDDIYQPILDVIRNNSQK
jgi:F420-0:gamma-glutamyl ligase